MTFRAAQVVETHISTVLLAGDRAYKLLRRVEMPFLDLTDRQTRLRAAVAEVELNRRIAPDVYLGLADVLEHGELVDRFIVMRRLPEDRRLSALVDDPSFADHLRAVARQVAAFHATLPPMDPAPTATRERVAINWNDNLDVIEKWTDEVIAGDEVERVAELARSFLDGRRPLFERRISDGMIRDGHGDLLADDIFCLDDGPRIIDCLAFNDDYRIGDVLLDVAFLAMDVERLAGSDHAASFLADYGEFSAETHPVALAHHYIAYRAHVRAKVACIRYGQGDESSAPLARSHHRLALAHLERARVRVILVGGGPGVGKTVLAHGMADHYECSVLSTDEIRKDLAGVPRGEHRYSGLGEGIYDAAMTDAVYAEQRRQAALLLSMGESVILDASWTHRRHRDAARELARELVAETAEIECVLDPTIAKQRVALRLSNPTNVSDATPNLVDHLMISRAPWPTATQVDTDASRPAVLATAVDTVDKTVGLQP